MWLWIALGLAVISGLAKPFGTRLHTTGLWAGKAIAGEGTEDVLPRGMQDAITHGWPSWVGMLCGMSPFIAGGVGLLYAWWAGLLAFLVATLVTVAAKKVSVAPTAVDHYLAHLYGRMANRQADYSAGGDQMRAQAAKEITGRLEQLLILYRGSDVPAPTIEIAQDTPNGDMQYLRKAYNSGEYHGENWS